jgi:hypothetical protein
MKDKSFASLKNKPNLKLSKKRFENKFYTKSNSRFSSCSEK